MFGKEKKSYRIPSFSYRYIAPVLCMIIVATVLLHGCKDMSPTTEIERAPEAPTE